MDQSYFSRYFKKMKGLNFSDAVTGIRLEHAKNLMRQKPGIALDELASACGFSSKTYFCEVFRKRNGVTVSRYQQLRAEQAEGWGAKEENE